MAAVNRSQPKSNSASSLVLSLILTLIVLVAPVQSQTAFANGGSITYNNGACELAAAGYLGTGAVNDRYQISDSESLWEMADCSLTGSPPVPAYFFIVNQIDASEATAGVPTHSPIGYVNSSLAYSFSGIVEGGEHTISVSMSTDHGVGLFAYLNSATINRLEIHADFETSSTVNESQSDAAGGLAIRSDGDSVIHGVTIRGRVIGNHGVGGLLGFVTGTMSISQVTNYATVSGAFGVGGLLGRAFQASIEDSSNRGGLFASGGPNSISNLGRIGGLVGEAGTLNIQGSGNQGDINAESLFFAGGLVGDVDVLTMAYSTNLRDISAFGGAGGLIGISRTSATVSGSENHGNLHVVGISGGLAGQVRGATAISASDNYGEVRGEQKLGGLVGEVHLQASTLEVEDSNNYGIISATSNWAGGLIGISDGGIELSSVSNLAQVLGAVTASDSLGGLVGSANGDLSIIGSSNTHDVTGRDKVGGLVGYVDGDLTVTQSSNTGNVLGQIQVGGVAGNSKGQAALRSVTNAGDVQGSASVGGLIGWASESADISDSLNQGNVTGTSGVGGFIGDARSDSLVSSSTNSGDISSSSLVGGFVGLAKANLVLDTLTNTGEITGGTKAGGLLGSGASVEVYFSLNRGTVSGTTSVGGLVGHLTSQSGIVESVNDGAVVGSGTKVGGLLGDAAGSATQKLEVFDSSNLKDITGGVGTGGLIGNVLMSLEISGGENYGTIRGSGNSGGLIGDLYLASNTDAYSSISDSVNAGEVIAVGGSVGGIVGNTSTGASHTLLRVINDGDVTATGTSVGGIFGRLDVTSGNSTASQIVNYGNISGSGNVGGLFGSVQDPLYLEDSSNRGNVDGDSNVGGLVGSTFTSGSTQIVKSFNSGVVIGTSKVDGLVGSESAAVTIFSSYTSVPSSFVATSTIAQMQSSALYVGWDFVGAWGFGLCSSGQGLPQLRYLASGFSSTACVAENSGITPNPQTPTPSYLGPIISSKVSGNAGEQVLLRGSRLNLISTISIAGLEVEILSASAEAITIVIPVGLTSGVKDLIVQSSLGRVTFMSLLEVMSPKSEGPSLQSANQWVGKSWMLPGSKLGLINPSLAQRNWISDKFKDSDIKRVVCTAIVTDQMTAHQRILVRKAAKAACENISSHLQSPSVWVQSKKTKHAAFAGRVLLTVKG